MLSISKKEIVGEVVMVGPREVLGNELTDVVLERVGLGSDDREDRSEL